MKIGSVLELEDRQSDDALCVEMDVYTFIYIKDTDVIKLAVTTHAESIRHNELECDDNGVLGGSISNSSVEERNMEYICKVDFVIETHF